MTKSTSTPVIHLPETHNHLINNISEYQHSKTQTTFPIEAKIVICIFIRSNSPKLFLNCLTDVD
jgi:hypothetical protein